MKLEDLRRLSAARTPPPWEVDKQLAFPNQTDVGFNQYDAEFIACAANHFDKMLDVIEAAKEVVQALGDKTRGLRLEADALERAIELLERDE